MEHPAELAIHRYLRKAIDGNVSFPPPLAKSIASDVEDAVLRQFAGNTEGFRLRMSNVGRKKCQLWFEKNRPELKSALPSHFIINMLLGDIVEAVFKGIMRAANVDFQDSDTVTLETKHGSIKGSYDMVLDNRVDDIKSASGWSYLNKFVDVFTLQKSDSFGYIAQLVGYAKAAKKEVGGWWVINKNTGEFKYVDAEFIDADEEYAKIEETAAYIKNDEPFERCYTDVPELYYGKPSGNRKLGVECSFCAFKENCWENLQSLPSKVSKAKDPPIVHYTHVVQE